MQQETVTVDNGDPTAALQTIWTAAAEPGDQGRLIGAGGVGDGNLFAAMHDLLPEDTTLHAPLALAALCIVAWLANLLVKRLLVHALFRQLNAMLADRQVEAPLRRIVARLANVVPALVFFGGIAMVPQAPPMLATIVQNTAQAFIVVTLALALGGMLDLLEKIHQARPDARNRPIKGYLQLGKIAVYLIASILMAAALIDRSPLILLSGVGAMAAVLMLIFQDTLLSMVASVQINSSGILRVGDWIEMPQLNADGAVIDIALHTVKIQNWDLTITTIPTKRLITDAFKNWRGMQESGGRRIKRALFLDQNSVHFIEADTCRRLRRFNLLDAYLEDKQREMAAWNADLAKRGDSDLNARRVSNLGTFRKYVERYLRSHPGIRKDMTLMVRQLSPTAEGLPLEIYCFTNTVAWAEYEAIQADLFDHLLAIVGQFELAIFQRPGGADMRRLQPGARSGDVGQGPYAGRNRTPAY